MYDADPIQNGSLSKAIPRFSSPFRGNFSIAALRYRLVFSWAFLSFCYRSISLSIDAL